MACLHTMYNNGANGNGATMSPRISFSNDFADAQHVMKQYERSSPREAPVSSDFEFSVTNYSMMSADELFSRGRLLPYKGSNKSQSRGNTTTLRDELLVEDQEECHVSSQRPPKGSSIRWKGLLGRKKSTTNVGSKKAEKASEGSSSVEGRRSGLVHENSSQEVLNEGGSSWRGFEIGI